MLRLALLCLAVAAVRCAEPPSPAAIIGDPARYSALLGCLGGQQEHCEPWVQDVRAHIPDALKTGCAACPAPHKDFIRTLTLHVKRTDPEQYQALLLRLDKDKDSDSGPFAKFLESSA
ncbi:uncharacterized protein LOC134532485 [Bacillus rossius redtenbacheri]|uniref:uncharacterized protein LOC134532485 n=1 Tax=Bacillus rossius redtenbacheri TaxID=93214 RepID=UPI002FDC7BC1